MIDEEETFRRFGYRSTELTSGSGKKVVAVCDGKNCGLTREVKMQDYRDLCHKCATTRANNSRVYTDKILEEMRMTHTGLKHTDKTKKKISKAMMGHEVSQDTRKKHRAAVLGENNPRFGVESSEKTKKKISDSAKKRWEEMSPEIRKSMEEEAKKNVRIVQF